MGIVPVFLASMHDSTSSEHNMPPMPPMKQFHAPLVPGCSSHGRLVSGIGGLGGVRRGDY